VLLSDSKNWYWELTQRINSSWLIASLILIQALTSGTLNISSKKSSSTNGGIFLIVTIWISLSSIFIILVFSWREIGDTKDGKSLHIKSSNAFVFIYKLVKNLYISNLLLITSILILGVILEIISSISSNCFSKIFKSLAITTK